MGDHVTVSRGDVAVAEGVLFRVDAHSSALVLTRQSQTARAGDTVTFRRHRTPPPKLETPASVPRPATGGPSSASDETSGAAPTAWRDIGTVSGLNGADWMEKRTRCAVVLARKGDLQYLGEVVDMLDPSFDINRDFMGVTPKGPMRFIFFSLDAPAHAQPGYATRLAARTRAAGVALSPENVVVVNLGNWRTGTHSEPWEVEKVCRHEMNHLFMFRVRGADRGNTWHWFAEALAHFIEDTVNPPSVRLTAAQIKAYMQGYPARDAGWQGLIGDRDNDALEQYRDYRKMLMSVIFFLQDRYGADVVRRLMLSVGQGRDIEDAFLTVTGKGAADLEAEWRVYYAIR